MSRKIGLISFEEMVKRFCVYLSQKGRNQVTIDNYRSDLEGLLRWSNARSEEKFDLGKFATVGVHNYRESLIRRFKRSTINRKLSTLKIFLRWAAGANLILQEEVPLVRNVRQAPASPTRLRWLDLIEQARLQRALAAGGAARDIAAITIMLNTGLRVSELCALQWEDVTINDDKGTLTVRRAKARKASQIPLNHEARKALLSLGYPHQIGTKRLIFVGQNGPMTRRGVEVLVDRYARIAGLENVTPLALRDTFCMNLVAAGVSADLIAELAGHGNLEMTRRYYEPSPQTLEQAVERLEAPSNPAADNLRSGRVSAAQSNFVTLPQEAPHTNLPSLARRKAMRLSPGYQPLSANMSPETPFASQKRSKSGKASITTTEFPTFKEKPIRTKTPSLPPRGQHERREQG